MRLNWNLFMAQRAVSFVLFTVVLCISPVFPAQQKPASQELFSPYSAQVFHKLAFEAYNQPEFSSDNSDRIMLLFLAAGQLDKGADYTLADTIILGSMFPDEDYFEIVRRAFEQYCDTSADLEVTRKALTYLMQRLDSREAREQMLGRLLKITETKNPVLTSEIATQLALLLAEKADFKNATAYLTFAYNKNPYNALAFAKLDELSRQIDQKLTPIAYADNLRFAMLANPLDIEAALDFAHFAEQKEMYELAANAYQYTAQLYMFLEPARKLPTSIYLPWALACYNTQRQQSKCIHIAELLDQAEQFDLILKAIAAKAAIKTGDQTNARQFQASGLKAENIILRNPETSLVTPDQIAWFYCFALPDPEKALAWANKAYSFDPDSGSAAAILAYTLVMNNQLELAQELIADSYQNNQIAALTMGIIQLSRSEKETAIQTWKDACKMDPASLAAEKVKSLLAENGSEYIPDAIADTLFGELTTKYGTKIVPDFKTPAQFMTAELKLGGSQFSYDSQFDAKLVITNKSAQPLIIFDGGMFTGNIRVDALVRGDINLKISELVSKKVRPSSEIGPNQFASIPLDLNTGVLEKLLMTYPQASVEIEFITYIDPVIGPDNKIINGLPGIEPVSTIITRQGLVLTREFLSQRLDVVNNGKEGQKIRAGRIFAGLMAEQQAIARSKPLYKYIQVEPLLLRDAVKRCLLDENWKVRLQTMAVIAQFPAILDYELTAGISENLNETHWPVRIMSLYLLGQTQSTNFQQVLDWTAKNDANQYVRAMAVALGGTEPQLPDTAATVAGAGLNKNN